MAHCRKISQLILFGLIFLGLPVQALPQTTSQVISETKNYNTPATQAAETRDSGIAQEAATLLRRIIVSLYGVKTLKTSSVMTITGSKGSATFSMTARVQTISQTPDQFRSKIYFTDPTDTVATYEIVRDRDSVWIYHPNTKRFSLQTYKQFEASNDDLWMGLLSGIHVSMRTGAFPIEEILASYSFSEQGTAPNGKNYAVFSMQIPDNKGGASTASAFLWVDPRMEQIEAISVEGTEKGAQYSFGETVLQQQKDISVSAGSFVFRPPLGARRVKKLEIEWFP